MPHHLTAFFFHTCSHCFRFQQSGVDRSQLPLGTSASQHGELLQLSGRLHHVVPRYMS